MLSMDKAVDVIVNWIYESPSGSLEEQIAAQARNKICRGYPVAFVVWWLENIACGNKVYREFANVLRGKIPSRY